MANKIICSSGIDSLQKMLPEKYQWYMPKPSTSTHIYLFVGLKNCEDLKLPLHNLWYYPYEKFGSYDLNELMDEYLNK